MLYVFPPQCPCRQLHTALTMCGPCGSGTQLIDVGTRAADKSIRNLVVAMEADTQVGGCCGEIAVALEDKSMMFTNPVVAAQVFEYKISVSGRGGGVIAFASTVCGTRAAVNHARLTWLFCRRVLPFGAGRLEQHCMDKRKSLRGVRATARRTLTCLVQRGCHVFSA